VTKPSDSIRTKLRVVILTTSMAVITITSVAFVAFEFITFRRSLVEHISSVSQMVAANCTSGLAFHDPHDVREILSSLAQDRYIVEGAVYDDRGKLFARFPSEFVADLFPPAPPEAGVRFQSRSLISVVPVVQDSRPLGFLYLRSDLEPMRERFRLHAIVLIAVLAVSSFVAWFLSGWLGRRIASPILGLADTARVLSRERDYSIRANRTSKDEVGDLTDAFNDMLGQIQEREATLRESAERLQLALAASRTGSWDWNLVTDRLAWDNFLHPLFGLKPGEFRGTYQHFLALIHPEDRAKVEQSVKRTFKERRDFDTTFRVVWPDGSVHHMASRGKPIFSADGKPVRMTGVTMDVTESQKAEQALRESEERFRTMANAAPVLIWTSGMDKDFDYFNRSWLDFTGRTFDQELGHGWLQGVHPEDIEHVRRTFSASIDCRIPFEMQFRLRRADGEYRWMLNHGVPRFTPDGAFQGYIGSCIDITERRLAQAELERRVNERTAELAEANRELESFTYSVSHDLRAPLRHVHGYAEILRDDYAQTLPEDAQAVVKRIVIGTENMSRLVDDLLRLARIGRQELALRPTNLNLLVQEVLDELKSETAQRNIDWKIQTLPEVSADPGLMKIVFTNLISNAVKYSRNRDRAVIEIGSRDEAGAPVFFIRDNGVGFNMKYADKLFGVFQRLHKQEQFEGTGVGLAIVDRIIRKHRGRIWAESEPDKGSTFYFTLQPTQQ
jgi:PAS domain S-box-containing protein